MATFTAAAVDARTTTGCTITFNAAVIDCNQAQLKQLQQLFNRLVMETSGIESDDAPAVITLGGSA